MIGATTIYNDMQRLFMTLKNNVNYIKSVKLVNIKKHWLQCWPLYKDLYLRKKLRRYKIKEKQIDEFEYIQFWDLYYSENIWNYIIHLRERERESLIYNISAVRTCWKHFWLLRTFVKLKKDISLNKYKCKSQTLNLILLII